MKNTTIEAIGHYVPTQIIDNLNLQKRFNIDENRIFERTGILERRYCSDDDSSTKLACKAITNMMQKTKTEIGEIDCIIISTLAPDFFFPSTAVAVIHELKAINAWGFDVSASCSGFLYSLSLAQSMIETGKAKKIIVCATERLSKMLNNFDYKTGVLFGDGAGAILLQSVNNREENIIINSICKVEADNINDVYFKTPFNSKNWNSEKFELEGYKVFQHGVELAISMINNYIKSLNIEKEDIDYVIPHQANARMLKEIAEGIGINYSKFLVNIDKFGNTGSASIPICMSYFYKEEKKIKPGDRLLLFSLGAGYTLSIVDLIWKI